MTKTRKTHAPTEDDRAYLRHLRLAYLAAPAYSAEEGDLEAVWNTACERLGLDASDTMDEGV